MKQVFSADLELEASRIELARKAADLLTVISEGTAVPTHAEWRLPTETEALKEKFRSHGLSETLLVIELEDDLGGQLTAEIRSVDLPHLRHRLIRIWGDMLAVRSDRLMRLRLEKLDREGAVIA